MVLPITDHVRRATAIPALPHAVAAMVLPITDHVRRATAIPALPHAVAAMVIRATNPAVAATTMPPMVPVGNTAKSQNVPLTKSGSQKHQSIPYAAKPLKA